MNPASLEKPENTAAARDRQGFGTQGPADTECQVHGLYMHLPFCFHKCHYCDFFSVVTNRDADDAGHDPQAQFTDALIAEFASWCDGRGRVGTAEDADTPVIRELRPSTIFVGGGTPTYLRPELWDRLLDTLRHRGVLERVDEFTVEANPETVTPELMQQLAAGGVNRVSIGAQSFDRASLEALERWHDPDNVPRAVDACRLAGIENVSLDLIFAIPGQTLDMLDRDLDRLITLRPTHLSIYGLTYEPQTALTARLRVGKVTPIDESTERAMYDRVMTRLDDAGYEHYELSNWCRRDPTGDLRCAHNLHYWRNRHWLGLGPGAASHIAGRRWRNQPNLPAYLDGSPHPPRTDEEHLPSEQRIGEQLMLGLRLAEGVSLHWLNQHLPDDDPRHATIREAVDLALLEITNPSLRLTREGRFVADSILARLL
ncbi:MAG: radical SAM family heme chaperone HemW [Planctomycetota bacterium]